MPYFVFHLVRDGRMRLDEINLVDQFDAYKEAKQFARAQRELDAGKEIKIMFEEDASMAESKLAEQRDAPILREWEK
ncbi:MAG: hypothetical protein P8O75_04025 [Gammaproteobacteria bacterium]|jgi:hypothetical protein|nr:hypothetical protein [Gammaproteobacteria bacterium]